MGLIDTHCHLTFDDLIHDIDALVERSRRAGVTGWITVGTDIDHSRKAIELAERFEDMYATVGIHPHDAEGATAETLAQLKELAQNVKVVAIGETGLDFHYNLSKQSEQRRVFAAQLGIAREMNLPVIVHSRDAFEETVDVLDRFGSGLRGAVFHCFGGTAEQAKVVLGRGHHISFTGVVTFKNAEQTRQAAGVVPVDRLMLETDCPYMSPEPMRKQKINEPALLVHTARYLAQLKNTDFSDFVGTVNCVSRDFFGLPEK